jgi:hypothetical protein
MLQDSQQLSSKAILLVLPLLGKHFFAKPLSFIQERAPRYSLSLSPSLSPLLSLCLSPALPSLLPLLHTLLSQLQNSKSNFTATTRKTLFCYPAPKKRKKTRTHSRTLTHSHTHTHALTHAHSRTLTPSLTHTHAHSRNSRTSLFFLRVYSSLLSSVLCSLWHIFITFYFLFGRCGMLWYQKAVKI